MNSLLTIIPSPTIKVALHAQLAPIDFWPLRTYTLYSTDTMALKSYKKSWSRILFSGFSTFIYEKLFFSKSQFIMHAYGLTWTVVGVTRGSVIGHAHARFS